MITIFELKFINKKHYFQENKHPCLRVVIPQLIGFIVELKINFGREINDIKVNLIYYTKYK